MQRIFALCVGLCLVVAVLEGQSYHYNSLQYGLRSTLLGGAVVAGSEDLSMVYYNPAALNYAKDKGFDLALIIPSFSRYSFGNYFSDNQKVNSNGFDLNSSLVTFKTGVGDQFDIVLSYLQKDVWDNDISFNETRMLDNAKIDESFQYEYEGDEKWFGFGTSYLFSPQISLGFSQFMNVFKSSYRYTIGNTRTDRESGDQLDFFSEDVDIRYSSAFALITKFGLSINTNQNRFGLVITTPNYLGALQNASYEKTSIEIANNESNQSIVADYSLDYSRKSPWEISAGYAKIFSDSTEIWLSAAYNSAIQEYELFTVDSQSSSITASAGAKDVFNFGLGFSAKINKKIQFLSSFRTNFFAYENQAVESGQERLHMFDASRLQIASGVKVSQQNASFVVGLDYGFSSESNEDLFNDFPNNQRFRKNVSSFNHNTMTILLTYEFFLNRMSKNISKLLDGN